MPELHIVYAVTRYTNPFGGGDRLIKHKVSDALNWHAAQDLWERLDNNRRAFESLTEWSADAHAAACGGGVDVRYHIGLAPVAFFAVRSSDDPDWPSEGHCYSNNGKAVLR